MVLALQSLNGSIRIALLFASAGGDWELASLVCVDLPQWFHDGCKASAGPMTTGHWIKVAVREVLGVSVFGGMLILMALVHVALVHCHGDGQEVP